LHVRAQVFSLQLLRLLRHGGQLLRTDRLRRSSLLPPPALARMVPVFARPVLATDTSQTYL
jgi:hypothetical protein